MSIGPAPANGSYLKCMCWEAPCSACMIRKPLGELHCNVHLAWSSGIVYNTFSHGSPHALRLVHPWVEGAIVSWAIIQLNIICKCWLPSQRIHTPKKHSLHSSMPHGSKKALGKCYNFPDWLKVCWPAVADLWGWMLHSAEAPISVCRRGVLARYIKLNTHCIC